MNMKLSRITTYATALLLFSISFLVEGCNTTPPITSQEELEQTIQKAVDDAVQKAVEDAFTNQIHKAVEESVIYAMDQYYFSDETNNFTSQPQYQNYEAKQIFADFFQQDTIESVVGSNGVCTIISPEDRKDAKYRYIELTEDKIPALLLDAPYVGHFIGEYQIWIIDDKNGLPKYAFGLDSFYKIYPEAGIAICCHWGGGYGETDSYYLKYQNNDIEIIASTSVMESDECAEGYLNSFGCSYEDYYCIGNHENETIVTKEEFEDWFNEQIEGSSCIDSINWIPLELISVDNMK